VCVWLSVVVLRGRVEGLDTFRPLSQSCRRVILILIVGAKQVCLMTFIMLLT